MFACPLMDKSEMYYHSLQQGDALWGMMTSPNGNIARVTSRLCGNSTVTGEFPAHIPATRSFDVFFDLRLHKRLSKQSWGWLFETPSRPLWRHCNWKAFHRDEAPVSWLATNGSTSKEKVDTVWPFCARLVVLSQYHCNVLFASGTESIKPLYNWPTANEVGLEF